MKLDQMLENQQVMMQLLHQQASQVQGVQRDEEAVGCSILDNPCETVEELEVLSGQLADATIHKRMVRRKIYKWKIFTVIYTVQL